MTKGQKAYWFAIITIIVIILLIIVSPITSADIEITVDEYEVTTIISDGNQSTDSSEIERLLYWHPMCYDFEKYQFITYDDLEVSKQELELIATQVYCEANLEPTLGQELVVVTILNRLYNHQTWWGFDINEIVDNPSQFNGTLNPNFGYYTDENIQNTINAIYKYNNRLYDDKFYDILYFNNPLIIDRDAYMSKYNLYSIIEIGGHLFMGENE